MGYLIVLLAVLAVAALLIPMLAGRRAPKPQGGILDSDHPVARTEPAADEATPGASNIATPQQQQNAGRRTPPA